MGDQNLRKAGFREMARDIILADRSARKHGRSQNTIGAIARALEWAYQRGVAGEVPLSPRRAPGEVWIEWIEIPPRPRGAFWSICARLFGLQAKPARSVDMALVQGTDRLGKVRWYLGHPKGGCHYDRDESWSDKSIAPLVRLGLLECQATASILQVTPKGVNTWSEYRRRDERFI